MGFLPESENYEPGVYQLEEDDDVLGGPGGPANTQAEQLANRTKYLLARALPAVRLEAIVPVIGAYAITVDDIGKALSVHDPAAVSFTLPAIAGFPKSQPITIVVTDDGGGTTVPIHADGADVIENFLNSGDGVVQYDMRPGTRLVFVCTQTSWVVVFKTEPQVFVAGYLPGDIKTTAAPISVLQPGFLLCDGSAKSRTAYAALFAAIGTVYGIGDGATTFNLPDHRDVFLRGHNNGGGAKDPGRVFGSYQGDALKDHVHGTDMFPGKAGAGGTIGGQGDNTNDGSQTSGIKGPDGGGIETRPKNITINTYIKY